MRQKMCMCVCMCMSVFVNVCVCCECAYGCVHAWCMIVSYVGGAYLGYLNKEKYRLWVDGVSPDNI